MKVLSQAGRRNISTSDVSQWGNVEECIQERKHTAISHQSNGRPANQELPDGNHGNTRNEGDLRVEPSEQLGRRVLLSKLSRHLLFREWVRMVKKEQTKGGMNYTEVGFPRVTYDADKNWHRYFGAEWWPKDTARETWYFGAEWWPKEPARETR